MVRWLTIDGEMVKDGLGWLTIDGSIVRRLGSDFLSSWGIGTGF